MNWRRMKNPAAPEMLRATVLVGVQPCSIDYFRGARRRVSSMSIVLLIALALGVFTALTLLVLAERNNIQRQL